MIKVFNALPENTETLVKFQKAMALETENLILDELTLFKGVNKIFENSEIGTYYIASVNNEIAGCMLTLYEWSDWRNAFVIWIHSVYVVPEYRKMKVFKCLYAHIKEIVEKNDNYAGLRLYVDIKNEPAQRVYENLGMNKNHYHLYEWLKN